MTLQSLDGLRSGKSPLRTSRSAQSIPLKGCKVSQLGTESMELITSNEGLRSKFSSLLKNHKHVSLVVAWASTNFGCCGQLTSAQRKIKRMIVGLHFCQTGPDFIQHFIADKRV